MKIKILVISLFLLAFSMSSQAQVALKGTKTVQHQEVLPVKKEATSTSKTSKTSTQQTKDNIRRRNMAKYRAMSQKSRNATTSEKKRDQEKKD